MSKQRKSFIVHFDSLNVLDDLTNEQAGLLFKAIKGYQLGDELELDALTKVAFSPFKNQFARDAEKYENLCEKNRLIAINRHSTKSTSGTSRNQSLPESTKCTDNDSKSKSDSKNDSDSNKEVTKEIVTSVPKFNFKNELLALNVDKDILEDWLTVRKKKKATNSKTAFSGLITEITNSGLSVPDAIKVSAENSWSGFKSSWYENLKPEQKAKSTHTFENQNYTSGSF